MERWNVDTTTLNLLRVGQPIIALYADGRSTIMKTTISVLVHGSSPIVIGRVIVPAFLGVMVIFTMEIIISSSIPFLGTNFDAIRRNQESFPLIWRKISVRVKLRGVVGGCVRLKSDPSILLLDDPEGLNRDEMVCPQHHLGNCEWLISLGRSKGSRTGFLAGPALSSQVGLAPRVLESPLGRPEGARAPVEVEPSSGRTEECEE
ncbi:hypothetical protein BHE74_00016455 [Ensete ventricosum]|nr:hypothetical protein BHE74_00016455 [Ensete ventricosum]